MFMHFQILKNHNRFKRCSWHVITLLLVMWCIKIFHSFHRHYFKKSYTRSVRKVSDLWPGKRNWLTWSVGHL